MAHADSKLLKVYKKKDAIFDICSRLVQFYEDMNYKRDYYTDRKSDAINVKDVETILALLKERFDEYRQTISD